MTGGLDFHPASSWSYEKVCTWNKLRIESSSSIVESTQRAFTCFLSGRIVEADHPLLTHESPGVGLADPT